MILLAVKIRSELRRHFWFWTTIVFVMLLHVPVADLMLDLGIIAFVEKFIVRAAPAAEDA
jgi:hypothetical protein